MISHCSPEHLLEARRGGEPVRDIAERIGRSRSSVYQLLRRARTREVMDMPDIEYVPNTSFYRDGAEERFRGPEPEDVFKTQGLRKAPPGLPPYLSELYQYPLLTTGGEQFLFRKFNYLKYRAEQVRGQVDPRHPKRGDIDMIHTLLQEASCVKQRIVTANLRLVVSTVKRIGSNLDTQKFMERVSDGNVILMRAVDKFDVSRGNKFSTYATWAVVKSLRRPEGGRMWQRTDTGTAFEFPNLPDLRSSDTGEDRVDRIRSQVRQLLETCPFISGREAGIIRARFGIGHNGNVVEPEVLRKIGQDHGITKERVRQLEARGMRSLKAYIKGLGLTFDSFEDL